MKAIDKRSILGRNLVRFRKAKHLTQVDLSRLTGISQPLIASYETKAIDPPVSAVLVLAKALGVSIHDLVEELPETPSGDLSPVDPRTLRKAMEITALSRENRAKVYRLINQLRTSSTTEESKNNDP